MDIVSLNSQKEDKHYNRFTPFEKRHLFSSKNYLSSIKDQEIFGERQRLIYVPVSSRALKLLKFIQ